ncbi:hypothetical protein V501_09542 [Pseudogymnoascus sp. VKM F-4519 (FW-2642)]|nr:hypothetical protein V501_09542 [Pseudogymnoascus sp. VKM F-4519 (FW-2642)]
MPADSPPQFTLFPLLPAELRVKIWQTALFERNSIVELRVINDAIIPKSRPSVVLRINQESRYEAFRALKALSDSLSFSKDGEAQNQLYLLPERDTIYFSNDYQFVSPSTVQCKMAGMAGTLSLLAASLSEIERAKIQTLAIDIYEWSEVDHIREILQQLIPFEGLKTLVVVMRDPVEEKKSGGGDRIFVDWPWSQRKPAYDLQTKLWKMSRSTLRYNPQWKEPVVQLRLAHFLDRPLFPWKKLIVGFSLAQYLFESYLSLRQYQVLKNTRPPKVLANEVSQEVFDKSQAYGRAKAQFSFVSSLYGQIQNTAFIYYDILPKLWTLTGSWLLRFAPTRFSGEISHSIVFVLTFIIIQQVLSLPTSIYSTFVLEEKFGFNKQTPKVFGTDILKSQMLAFILAPPILAGFLKIVQKTGNQFFYYLWLFGAALQVFMITVYPITILPLFNKLSPLDPGALKTGVEGLAQRLNFPLKELYVIDGSKRSAHSNAYFFGLPWKKHIVIYDTLIEKSETEEVVAVLAHELGHWSLGHTTRLFAISQVHFFYIFSLFSVFINNKSLYRSFGFHTSMPIIIGFILFSDALAPMDTVIKLLMNILSRRYEFQADEFAQKLGYSTELAKSLIKLQIQNLSTMDADWMYATYHFSHPILSERLGALGWHGDKSGDSVVDEKNDGAVKASGRDEL